VKILLRDTVVWGVPEAYYTSNTRTGWKAFRETLSTNHPITGWRVLRRVVKEDYVLLSENIQPWHDASGGREFYNILFYQFPQPIEGHIGFIFLDTSMEER